MSVDVHAHIIVPEILREAAPAETWRPRVLWEDGKQWVEYGGRRIGSAVHEFVDADKILAEMTARGVNGALLCPWVSLVRYDAPAAEALASCEVQNDALAALSKKHAGSVAALGLVPLQDVGLAVRELERLMGLGLKGVEIGTHVNGVYPGDARFWPFWEACEALDTFVFVHPVEGGGREELKAHYLWNVIGNPMETTVAAAHLILNGVLGKHPGLKILLAHGGGGLPALRGRLEHGFKVRPEIQRAISEPPLQTIRRFYFDTITHEPRLLRDLVETVGAERVLMGSDYPFDMGVERPIEALQGARLQGEELVQGKTAAGLFDLDN